jgi:hypothetical protein
MEKVKMIEDGAEKNFFVKVTLGCIVKQKKKDKIKYKIKQWKGHRKPAASSFRKGRGRGFLCLWCYWVASINAA